MPSLRRTVLPRIKTPAMPLQPFRELSNRWPQNDGLSIKDLRLKAICLLAIAFMLRPSDIAPRGVHETEDGYVHITFSIHQVRFLENGNLVLIFHGINLSRMIQIGKDSQWRYHRVQNKKNDHVQALKTLQPL